MPKGPQGQKRPADTVAAAIRTAKILTGEETEEFVLGQERRRRVGEPWRHSSRQEAYSGAALCNREIRRER